MIDRRLRALAGASALAVLSACGSGSSGAPVPAQGVGSRAEAKQALTVTVAVPGRSGAAHRRKPAYVATTTASMAVTVTSGAGVAGAPTIVNCTDVCSASVGVAPGSATIAVSLFDDVLGHGNVLSRGSTTTTIVANTANVVRLTFDPVVAAFSVGVPTFAGSNPYFNPLVIGQASTVSNVFTAFDADGNTLIGPGSYVDASGNAVTFTFTNSGGGHTSLSAGTLALPGPIALSYDGHGVVGTLSVSSPLGQRSSTYASALPPEAQDSTKAMWPEAMAVGADGNVWFVENGTGKIYRRNADGTISSFALVPPTSGGAIGHSIVLAGDNALWVAYGNQYERVTASGSVTAYTIPQALSYYSIDNSTRDASGNVIFATFDAKLASIANDGTVTQLTVPNASGYGFSNLVLGPDHRVWFLDKDAFDNTTLVAYGSGTFTRYPTGSNSIRRFFVGPDGTFWVPYASANTLVKFDTSGNLSSVTLPAPAWSQYGGSPGIVAAALDGKGNFYFADSAQNGIGRIDASLNVVEYPVSPGSLYPVTIVFGTDGKLYYGDSGQTGSNGPQYGGLGSVDPALL